MLVYTRVTHSSQCFNLYSYVGCLTQQNSAKYFADVADKPRSCSVGRNIHTKHDFKFYYMAWKHSLTLFVKWKTFTLLCGKLVRHIVYQILPASIDSPRRILTSISRNAIYMIVRIRGISVRLATNVHHVCGLLEMFSRSEVKGQGHYQTNQTVMAKTNVTTVQRRGLLVCIR